MARRREVGNAWLATHVGALNEADRLALERAVGVLESFTAQLPADHHKTKPEDHHPGDHHPGDHHHRAKEAPA
jgi:hypothetical protein